jgi:hypothetical protein
MVTVLERSGGNPNTSIAELRGDLETLGWSPEDIVAALGHAAAGTGGGRSKSNRASERSKAMPTSRSYSAFNSSADDLFLRHGWNRVDSGFRVFSSSSSDGY